jgi:very-short-patch-repair endonuclease
MRRKIIPYNPNLRMLARELRNNSTLGEVLLWKSLKGKNFYRYDFHRQKPLRDYIVDFYCYELNLVIEIDGEYHSNEDAYSKDLIRENRLKEYNLHFLRFAENQVRFQLINVLRAIEIYVEDYQKHTPTPSQEGNAVPKNERG